MCRGYEAAFSHSVSSGVVTYFFRHELFVGKNVIFAKTGIIADVSESTPHVILHQILLAPEKL